ncbi:hypothetical protein BRADI_2g01182v3 [Brachypodium distachyon]|uniref:Reverse transcriptase zinc-binding domain-containing protein n=1 Tax=Brachypodium distachyon TaxID=15368 RepID=A0A2K2D6C0_BRADI|nr:hypothetical protein BRADI_2g01182v3 [Brachypodium distachyon]
MKKYFGGLGILNLRDLNISLLASWIKRYQLDDLKIWKQVIQYKYDADDPSIFALPEVQTSPFWKGVLWARRAAKMGYRWQVGNGKTVKFWENQWIGNASLAIMFWDICIVCNQQNVSVHEVWDGEELKLSFWRGFNLRFMAQWYDPEHLVAGTVLSDEHDSLIWKLHQSGCYTSQSSSGLMF